MNQDSLELDEGTVNLFESYDEYGRNMSYLMNRRPSSGPVELLTSGMWRWDGEGRLTQAGLFSVREIQYSYLPGTHLLAGITMDNGVSMAHSYEPQRDLVIGIAYRKEDGTHLATRTYAYDALGRPIARTQQRGTETPRQDAFGYNTRSELTSATVGSEAFSYGFDNIGNRKTAQQTTENLTYDTNPLNQYTSITEEGLGTLTPTFDADGNQTHVDSYMGNWDVVYDANNRPVRFTKADGSVIVENGYDFMGRRYMQKVTENGTVTRHERYLYRGYLQIAALDILHGGKQKHALFWDPTEPLATRPLILLTSDDNRYAYAHDLTKNVTELLDAEGNIAATYDYDPFGKVTQAGAGAGLNPIQWSSEVYDAELALVYYNYRHYNPADGRWINRDPIAERGGLNLYGFVGNNSNLYFDELGLSCLSPENLAKCIGFKISIGIRNFWGYKILFWKKDAVLQTENDFSCIISAYWKSGKPEGATCTCAEIRREYEKDYPYAFRVVLTLKAYGDMIEDKVLYDQVSKHEDKTLYGRYRPDEVRWATAVATAMSVFKPFRNIVAPGSAQYHIRRKDIHNYNLVNINVFLQDKSVFNEDRMMSKRNVSWYLPAYRLS